MPTLINQGKIEMSVQDHVSSSMNDSGTSEEIDTSLTQESSRDVLARSFRDLTALRNIHGSQSEIGLLCSKLMEQLDNLPPGPEDRIEYLTPDWVKDQRAHLLKSIEFSKRDLQRAMRDVQ